MYKVFERREGVRERHVRIEAGQRKRSSDEQRGSGDLRWEPETKGSEPAVIGTATSYAI
jgi:hypothetical protein